MDYNEDDLTTEVSLTLEKDLSRFVEELRNDPQPCVNGIQSTILTGAIRPQPISGLGEELMKELLTPTRSDIKLKVGAEVFLCHKQVLCARCEYFDAMLHPNWAEATSNEITLNKVDPAGIAALLCFLYGGSIEMAKFCPLILIAQVADMYGVLQLSGAIKLHVATVLCHSFHRPCKECTAKFAEVLRICAIFGDDELLNEVLKWNSKYFCKLWHNSAYYGLPSTLHKKCLAAVKISVNLSNVAHVLIQVDKLLSVITRVMWSIPVVANASELLEYCCSFILSNFRVLIKDKSIFILFQGMGFKSDVVERVLVEVSEGVTINNACDIHLATTELLTWAKKELFDEDIKGQIHTLHTKVRRYLVANHFAIIHSASWRRLTDHDRMTINAEAVCGGDENRKLAKKPVLSSSLNIKPPTPRVLVTMPKKVLTHRRLQDMKHRFEVDGGAKKEEDHSNVSFEPPERQPINSSVEFMSGPPIHEVSVLSYCGEG